MCAQVLIVINACVRVHWPDSLLITIRIQMSANIDEFISNYQNSSTLFSNNRHSEQNNLVL